MMFTATWPREVQTLAREFLRNPVEIKFGETNKLNANKAITQIIKVIGESEKPDTLKEVRTHSLTHWLTHSMAYLLSYLLTGLLTGLLTHLLTHSLRNGAREGITRRYS